MNINEYVIVSDFDGTIICEDSNDLLVLIHGNAENIQIENDFRTGVLSTGQAMIRHFNIMSITLETYHSFLSANISIDAGFDAFLQQIRKHAIPFFIVSAGFRQAIQHVLGQERLCEVQVFANDLIGEGRLKPFFAQVETVCTESAGPCGNCKKACIEMIRRQTNRNVLYIGDGLTDRCAAHHADLIFAKKDLAHYCQSNSLPYIPYNGFADITKYLWPDILSAV